MEMSNTKMKNIHDTFIHILFLPRSLEYRIFITENIEYRKIHNIYLKRLLLEKSFGPIGKGKISLICH